MTINVSAFTTELYGVSQPSPNVLNSQKRLYMPIWSEDESNTFMFDGWYVPQTVTVTEGNATILPGPDATRTVDGVTYTTPSFFEILFDTPGIVKVECSLTTIDSGRTVTAIRDFVVAGE